MFPTNFVKKNNDTTIMAEASRVHHQYQQFLHFPQNQMMMINNNFYDHFNPNNSNVAYGSGWFVPSYHYGSRSQVSPVRNPETSKDFKDVPIVHIDFTDLSKDVPIHGIRIQEYDFFKSAKKLEVGSSILNWDNNKFKNDKKAGEKYPLKSKIYSCKYCERQFCSSQALGGHIKAHNRERPAKKNISSKSKIHRCKYCERHFNSPQALGGHIKVHYKHERQAESMNAIKKQVSRSELMELDLSLKL